MTFQKFFSVELKNFLSADLLKDFLHENSIRFESSGCFNLIHFQIFIPSKKEYDLVNSFLMFLPD